MLCWIGDVSNATMKYGCVIKYVFVYIGTMMSCIYFQRVVAVLMKGVDEGNEECPSSNTSRKMLRMKRPAVCGPHHAASCEEDKIA